MLGGAAAWAVLADATFTAAWTDLLARCPWGTVLQSVHFVNSWYHHYEAEYSPIVLAAWAPDGSGALTGLLLLAEGREGRLAAAGSVQAEYQAWLALPGQGDRFIEDALDLLAAYRPHGALALTYLPPGAPLGWTAPGTRWGSRVVLRALPRPLQRVDGEAARQSLRKSGNRSRLNRLARLGAVRFERLRTPAELEPVLDEIVAMYDFRRAAGGTRPPFRSDPHKRAFHLALLARPGVLHVSVLRVGDRVAAAHLGYLDGAQLSIGIIAHAPDLAAHSPGKLLLLHLAAALADEGITQLDLTPAGEYKERFATHHDTVHELVVHLSERGARRHARRRAAVRALKDALVRLRLEPAARRAAAELARARSRGAVRALRALAERVDARWRRTELLALVAPAVAPGGAPDPEVRLASPHDLLDAWANVAGGAGMLALAERWLAEGTRCYVVRAGGEVAHLSWLGLHQVQSHLTEVDDVLPLPPGSAVLFDCRTFPAHRSRGLFGRVIRRALHDAAAEPGIERVIAFVLRDNVPSRRALERAGLVSRGSVTLHRRPWGRRVVRMLAAPFEGRAADA